MADEQVRYDVLIEAKKAIKELREMSEAATSVHDRVSQFSRFLVESSRKWNIPVQQLLNTFKKLNAEMAKQKTQTIFGNTGGQNIFNLSEQYLKSAQAAGRFKTDNDGVVKSIQNVKGQMDVTEKAVKKTGDAMEGAGKKAQGFRHGIDVVRTALGTLLAVGIFQVLGAITNFFSGAIEQAKQFEATLYRLANAERQLSLEGVEVSVKGLKKGIEDLKKAFPIFSKEDLAELVGGIATTTKELGLSEEQMLKLAGAVAILNINSTESETLLQTMGKVVNSVISPQAKSVGNLGLSFGKAKIEAKAFEMQLLKTGETFEDLTEKEKTDIKYQIVLDTAGIENIDDLEKLRDVIKEAGGDFSALDAYLESNAAKLDANTAAWKDLQTTVGQIILPLIPALTGFLKIINNGFNALKVGIIEVMTLFSAFGVAWVALQTGVVQGMDGFVNVFKTSVSELRKSLVNDFFKEIPDDAPKWFMEGWGKHIKEQSETATAGVDKFGEAIKEIDTSALEKVRDIFQDTANAVEDLAEKLFQKIADLDTEYKRKAADAEVDYLRKVEDINRDAERDLARIKERHREQDQRDEERYQLQLWELRMRFLMDLEDALHARDARQVIRLQKQYALDKEALRRKHELEGKEREQSQRNELEDIEDRRQERLADARIEYEQKLADLNLAKQREQEDLNKWYLREFNDLKEAQDRKLKELLVGWAKEQEITEENAAAVYAILQKYFGPGGYTDALYQYMMQSLIASTQNAIGAAMSTMPTARTGIVGGTTSSGSTGGGTGRRSGSGGRGRAEGGKLIATRPTMELFGEAGPELVEFTPLNRIGRDVNKLDVSGSLAGLGAKGEIIVGVNLSPDLRAEIIEDSMNGVADVVFKVNGTKV